MCSLCGETPMHSSVKVEILISSWFHFNLVDSFAQCMNVSNCCVH